MITASDCVHVSDAAKALGLDRRYIQRAAVRDRLGLRVVRHPLIQDDRLRFFDRASVEQAAVAMQATRQLQQNLRAATLNSAESKNKKEPLVGSFLQEKTT